MRKKVFIAALMSLFVISTLPGVLPGQEDARQKILEATDLFFNPAAAPGQDKLLDSLFQLLDVAALITTAAAYKEDIQYRIDVAKELFKDDSLFNDKARQYLSFAYRMMTDGKKYEKPAELDVFVTPQEGQEKAMKYAKGLVDRALAELEGGNPGKTAILLLELVLMIITPVEGQIDSPGSFD